MISLRLLVCFMTLWYFSHALKNALIFNSKEKKLVEIGEFDDKAECQSCISACPITSKSTNTKQKVLNDEASVTKNSIFLRKVYPPSITASEMEIQICGKAIRPGLVWNTESKSFDAGYEMYYEEGQVDLKDTYYDNYFKVVEDHFFKTSLEQKQTPSQDKIKIYKEAENTKFEVVGQPGNRLVFYFIDVLYIDIGDDEKTRAVTFVADTINDYPQQTYTISQCETYFFGDSTKVIARKQKMDAPVEIPAKRRRRGDGQSDSKAPELKTTTKKTKNLANRLVKTQILPMRMFHTLSARLVTCMYLNIAFVWEKIANNQLRRIDLYLYALYRLFPSDVELNFGVGGKLRGIDPDVEEEIKSEHQLFTKFPVPEVIFRFVDVAVAGKLHGAVVIIHNNIESVQDEDRICRYEEEQESWDVIKNMNPAIGFSYTCKQTGTVYKKLGLDENAAPLDMIPLELNKFPYKGDSDGSINYKSVLDKIDNELNRIKELKIEY